MSAIILPLFFTVGFIGYLCDIITCESKLSENMVCCEILNHVVQKQDVFCCKEKIY